MRNSILARLSLCVLLAVPTIPSQAQTEAEQGYGISSDAVVVDQAAHWATWTRPKHAVEIDPDNHTVGPRLLRALTNAIADIDQFQTLIGNQKAYEKLLKDLRREDRPVPLNIRTAPATVAGVPIVYLKANKKKGIEVGDPILWYYLHGGIKGTPTNPEAAANILDGDPNTYWEPSSEVSEAEYGELPAAKRGPVWYFAKGADRVERRVDRAVYEATSGRNRRIEYHSRSLANWYVDVDLGRLVAVSKIVLRFVEPEVGEPFRQVRILGTATDLRDASLSLVDRTITPNEDRPVVEFDLDPDDAGYFQQLHHMRIAITDSKLDKFREVSEEEFLSLPVGEQGGIDYHIVNATGGETRVDKEIYDQVAPDRQGRLIHFQRERPRLADIEMWSQGDNIALGIIDGGGSVDLTGRFPGTPGFDGRYESNYLQLVWSPDPRYNDRGILTLDLGALFWLNYFRMVGWISTVDNMVVRASDGARDANGNLKWTEIHRQQGGNVEQGYAEPFQTRFLTTQLFSEQAGRAGGYNTGDRIREFQQYGEGYPSEITLTSPIIELPGSVILGRIEWEAEIPDPNLVDVQIRTRTGDRLIEVTEYYGSGGETKTATEYNKLPTSFQGPVVTRIKPGGGWSSWSQRYLSSGDPVTSPSPRRFLQFQVQLLSQSPDVSGRLRSVRVNFLPPIAHRAVAEIWPNEVPLGVPQDFELYLDPSFVERRPGGQPSRRFDEILMDGSPIQELEIREVSLGNEEEFSSDTPQSYDEREWEVDPVSGERSPWFIDSTGARFQALTNPESGDTLKAFPMGGEGEETSRWLLHLPAKVNMSPRSDTTRIYHRTILTDAEEVPVDEDGRPLNELTYLSLPLEQQGQILYFAIAGENPDGTPIQEPIDESGYRQLAISLKGEVRYFRILLGKGGEFPFDRDGAPLDQSGYNALPPAERGSVVATGRLVRVRLRAKVLLHGTTIDASVRDSGAPESWQQVDAGDATALTPGAALSIAVPFSSQIVQDIAIDPNPFTPNGDGVNDQMQIRFSLGNLNIARRIRVEIHDLGGRQVWERTRMSSGDQSFVWQGRNSAGEPVPPGLYVCRIAADIDAESASRQTDLRVIAVAY